MSFQAAPYYADVADGPDDGHAVWAMASDDVRIRVGLWPGTGARGTVLMWPGRTEFIEKYGRFASDMTARGFSVAAIDWRGQGLADRLAPDRSLGHIGDFPDYQRDVKAMLAVLEGESFPKPWFVVAHSMGGAIGLRALIEGLPVERAAFTGPMWGINVALPLRPFAKGIAGTLDALGQGLTYSPNTGPENYALTNGFDGNNLTSDRDMFDYMSEQMIRYPGLAIGGPSAHWVHQALGECAALEKLDSPSVPTLCFLGGDESIVDTSAVRARMDRWPNGQLHVLPGGQHEVLMETPEIRKTIVEKLDAHFTV